MADLSKLIDKSLLKAFGEQTIVPIKGTIGALAVALQALSDEVDEIEGGGGGSSAETEARLDTLSQNILALTLAVTLLQNAEVDGTADNVVVETFSGTSGYILISGMYDSTNHRLYA